MTTFKRSTVDTAVEVAAVVHVIDDTEAEAAAVAHVTVDTEAEAVAHVVTAQSPASEALTSAHRGTHLLQG